MYLYYIFGIISLAAFIGLDSHNVIKEHVTIKYRKWKSVNKLVSSKYKNRMTVIWISIKLICEAIYVNLLQYLTKSLVRLDKNTYELTYVINGNLYKCRIKVKKGPKPILQIIDHNSYDVTEVVLPYLGPEYNWHGNKISPNGLGYNSLSFELSDGEEKFYDKHDIVSVFE
jgi:hypothetical protein